MSTILGGLRELGRLYVELPDSCTVEDVLADDALTRTRTVSLAYATTRADLAAALASLEAAPADLVTFAGRSRAGSDVFLSWGAGYALQGGAAVANLSPSFARLDASWQATITEPADAGTPATDAMLTIGGLHESGRDYLETYGSGTSGTPSRVYNLAGIFMGHYDRRDVETVYIALKKDLRAVLASFPLETAALETTGGQYAAVQWGAANLRRISARPHSPSMARVAARYSVYAHDVVAHPPAGVTWTAAGSACALAWDGATLAAWDSGVAGRTAITFGKIPVSGLTVTATRTVGGRTVEDVTFTHGVRLYCGGVLQEDAEFVGTASRWQDDTVNTAGESALVDGAHYEAELTWRDEGTRLSLVYAGNTWKEWET